MSNISNPADNSQSSGDNEFKAGLTLDQQLALVKGMQSKEGMKRFGDELTNNRLTALLPLHIANRAEYKSVVIDYPARESVNPFMMYQIQADSVGDLPGQKFLVVETDCMPEKLGEFELRGWIDTSGTESKGNKGLSMRLNYKLIGQPNNEVLAFRGGTIAAQTQTEGLAYDAVCVINPDGILTDILPPGDYNAEKNFGGTLREAAKRARQGNLQGDLLGALDQIETDLEDHGVRLAHQRPAGIYDSLQADVSGLINRPLDKILFAEIDPLQTFEAIMNNPPNLRPAVKRGGMVSVPPIVFK